MNCEACRVHTLNVYFYNAYAKKEYNKCPTKNCNKKEYHEHKLCNNCGFYLDRILLRGEIFW